MPKQPWIETEKESELVNGVWVDKKKRYTRPIGINHRTKEIWDIIFKFFAAIAIFSPFLIISLQNKSNVTRERKANLSLVYSGILTDLRVYRTYSNTTDTANFKGVINRLGAEYPAKLAVYGNDQITNIYDTVVRSIAIWQLVRDLRSTYRRLIDETDLLGNMSDYLRSDTIMVMTYRSFKRDTTTVLNHVLGLFTYISEARDICTEIIEKLRVEDPKHFGQLHQAFITGLEFINHLDRQNTVTWDAFTFDTHKPGDEIALYYMRDYNRINAEINDINRHVETVNNIITKKQASLQSEFRKELK